MDSLEIQKKRQNEQNTVTFMIQIYCQGKHKSAWKEYKRQEGQTSRKNFLCSECQELAEYARQRSQQCPYIAKGTKTFCSQCKTHCYKSEYREKIRKVMRYSGPRMIFYMPGMCLSHAIKNFKH